MGIRIEESDTRRENDRKKKYLREYRKHKRRMQRIEAEIEKLRRMRMYPSLNNDGMPHGSGQSDLSAYAAVLTEKEEALHWEGEKQMQTYRDISMSIQRVEDPDERDVLFYRYIKGLDWWKVAQRMGYRERWIYLLHGRVLKNFRIPERVQSSAVLHVL